jgi:hypothetical protein
MRGLNSKPRKKLPSPCGGVASESGRSLSASAFGTEERATAAFFFALRVTEWFILDASVSELRPSRVCVPTAPSWSLVRQRMVGSTRLYAFARQTKKALKTIPTTKEAAQIALSTMSFVGCGTFLVVTMGVRMSHHQLVIARVAIPEAGHQTTQENQSKVTATIHRRPFNRYLNGTPVFGSTTYP